jgi:hypothetical protein
MPFAGTASNPGDGVKPAEPLRRDLFGPVDRGTCDVEHFLPVTPCHLRDRALEEITNGTASAEGRPQGRTSRPAPRCPALRKAAVKPVNC